MVFAPIPNEFSAYVCSAGRVSVITFWLLILVVFMYGYTAQ